MNGGSYYNPEQVVGIRRLWAELMEQGAVSHLAYRLAQMGYTLSVNGWGPVPGFPEMFGSDGVGFGGEDWRDHVDDGWLKDQPTLQRYIDEPRPSYDGSPESSGWFHAHAAPLVFTTDKGEEGRVHAPSFFRVRPYKSRSDRSRTYFLGSAVNTFFTAAGKNSFFIADQLSPGFEHFDLSGHPVIHDRVVHASLLGRRAKKEGEVYWRSGWIKGRRQRFGINVRTKRAVFG